MLRTAWLVVATLAAVSVSVSTQTWTQCKPQQDPPFSHSAEMAYDEARRCLVRFGGGNVTTYYTNETWVYDGDTWSQRFPATRPPGRFGHAMIYDTARQRVVLFGGYNSVISFDNDTWEWDGNDWTLRQLPASPPRMDRHAMAYDSARRRVVLFGGETPSGSWVFFLNQTWEYDGNTWVQCLPAVSPPARVDHAMAYDSARQRVVLFGGVGLAGEVNDTWEWDGNNWVQRNPACSPPSRYRHAMAYHPIRQRTVLVGGWSAFSLPQFPLGGTWEWDGAEWMEFTGGTAPSPRIGHVMAFNSRNKSVMLVGGASPGTPWTDTWMWGNPPLVGAGTGAIGTTVNLTFTSANDPGLPYFGASSFGTGPIQLGGGRWIDLSPDPLFAVSIIGGAPGIFAGYQGDLDPSGKATPEIHIPDLKPLIGQRIHTAFVTVDLEAPQGIRSISQTFSFTVVQ